MIIDAEQLTRFCPRLGILAHLTRAFITRKPYFFNRQRMRLRVFYEINARVPFENYIETGTYLGMTTHFLAGEAKRRQALVYSCEINEDYYRIAKRTVGDISNVSLHCGNSVDFLRSLSATVSEGVNFVYLDAHGRTYLPLRDELLVVRDWPNTIIMIDDFKVPHDQAFGWDKYDEEREICLSHVAPSIALRPVYFPNYSAGVEGAGIARGYCVIPTSDHYADVLDQIRLLTRAV